MYFPLQKFAWYDKDPDTVDIYLEYLTSLLSAHAHHLHTILSSLTKHLWEGPREGGEGGGKAFGNIHQAIQSVLAQTPLATSVLMQLIAKGYPFRGKGVQIQVSLQGGICTSGWVGSVGGVCTSGRAEWYQWVGGGRHLTVQGGHNGCRYGQPLLTNQLSGHHVQNPAQGDKIPPSPP